MDVLRNLFGNLSSGIIRLLVTVGILAAVYLFIVKPTLDTTNNAINAASTGFAKIPESTDLKQLVQQSNPALQQRLDGQRQVRLAKQLRTEIRRIQRKGDVGSLNRMGRCLTKAHADLEKAVRCTRKIR